MKCMNYLLPYNNLPQNLELWNDKDLLLVCFWVRNMGVTWLHPLVQDLCKASVNVSLRLWHHKAEPREGYWAWPWVVGRLRSSLQFGQIELFSPCEPFPKATDTKATGFTQREQVRSNKIEAVAFRPPNLGSNISSPLSHSIHQRHVAKSGSHLRGGCPTRAWISGRRHYWRSSEK